MAGYGQVARRAEYERAQLGLPLALQRASTMRLDHALIDARRASVNVTIHNELRGYPARYAVYDINNLGYPCGTREVYLPAAKANPPPVHEQWRHTSAHLYEPFFCGVDLPPLMFRLEPHHDNFRDENGNDHPVPDLYDQETRRPVKNGRGAHLRYFSFLPRYIAYGVNGSLLDFWFKLDPRLEMNDILMRMEPSVHFVPGKIATKGKVRNALRMRRDRNFRDRIGLARWGDSRLYPGEGDVKALDKLDSLQICLNTTMIVDMPGRRLLKPSFLDKACRHFRGYIDSGLPLHYFLQDAPDSAVPSRKMLATLELRARMQHLAVLKGVGGTLEDNWIYLNKIEDWPPWWNDKAKGTKQAEGRKIHEIDNLTHKEWAFLGYGDNARGGWRERQQTRGDVI
ncbi:hypothetical protein LTS08_007451 [Lithohypha guttulata]|nr:hypothetical protein LTS08_007451 [Lithohypha guttulata]